MAYEFELHELEGPFTDAEGSKIVEFILGFDAEASVVVVMSVMLVPTEQADTLELCFGIRRKDDAGNVNRPDYSKEGSATYIPKGSKNDVLESISRAVSTVVSDTMPEQIIMETFYANLPPEALTKYSVIGAKIIVCGYIVEEDFRDPDSGINYWLFKKRD